MTLFKTIMSELEAAIATIDNQINTEKVTIEPPRDPSHGDLSTNAAMVLAKPLSSNPRSLAERLVELLSKSDYIDSLDIAGPGFINMRLKETIYHKDVQGILLSGLKTGESILGQEKRVNVEYVSANPTGPLTVGHARGAVVGDALARLLKKAGYSVQKEYYTNDFGNQVNILSETVALRYKEAITGQEVEIPKGYYPGEYLKEVGQGIADKYGDSLLAEPKEQMLKTCQAFTIEFMMAEIKKDLEELGVQHDLFYSEAAMVKEGKVEKALNYLTEKGLIYQGVLEPPKGKTPDDWEPREQTLFRSSDYGDDTDRPLKKSDGTFTYFANDIAHYYDIYQQNFPILVNVLGADHGGYVKRAKAAVDAMTQSKGKLEVLLCQIVHTFDNGQPVRMSKRAGTFVTLRDMMDRVGPDVMRFIMLTRKSDQTLEFDFAKVQEASKDNPVFYVQYAHARCCSVLRHAQDMFEAQSITDEALSKADLSLLDETEKEMIRSIVNWPRIVEQAAIAFEPHRIAFYLQDVASAFNSWWNKGRDDATLRFLIEDNKDLTLARLALVRATAITLASALDVMGVKALEELRSTDLEDEEQDNAANG